MNVKQYYLVCRPLPYNKITDDRTKTAAVVDPQRDIEQYLDDAAAGAYQIKHVLPTHSHADFLAGHIELRNRVGARIYLGNRAEAEFDFVKVRDGDRIEFGDVRLEILETPGHTPEGISILVFDVGRDTKKPYAVLTGDTLFIGDVGRPPLLACVGGTADELDALRDHALTHK